MADIEKTRKLQYKIMQDIAAGALIPMIRIGDELGLFKNLHKFGPCTPSISKTTITNRNRFFLISIFTSPVFYFKSMING